MAPSMLDDVAAGACVAEADVKLLAHISASINVKHAIGFMGASVVESSGADTCSG
jgi:hypothetical protein